MVSKEKAAQSATLAALQKVLREELVKLLLPAAEAAKEVMNITTPEKSPEVLMSSIFEFFAPTARSSLDEECRELWLVLYTPLLLLLLLLSRGCKYEGSIRVPDGEPFTRYS